MADAPPIQWREPESFAAGDTLKFQRSLPNYSPGDGWAIRLTVTDPASGAIVTQIVSTPDATNTYHTFNVPNFLAATDAGGYVLSEDVVNAAGNATNGIAAGEKHQIWFDDQFMVTASPDAGLPVGPIKTEAQLKITNISATLDSLYGRLNKETDVQRNRFILQDIEKMETSFKFWTARRDQEVQQENIRNGRASGANSVAVFAIG